MKLTQRPDRSLAYTRGKKNCNTSSSKPPCLSQPMGVNQDRNEGVGYALGPWTGRVGTRQHAKQGVDLDAVVVSESPNRNLSESIAFK